MSNDTPTKSKEYIRPMPANWWLTKRTYLLFMIRELTSVFVAAYAVFLLVLAMRRNDPEAFASLLSNPLLIALQVICLPMVVFHTITWLNLTPKVLVVWRGEDRVNPLLIAGAHYVAWAIISIVILSISCP